MREGYDDDDDDNDNVEDEEFDELNGGDVSVEVMTKETLDAAFGSVMMTTEGGGIVTTTVLDVVATTAPPSTTTTTPTTTTATTAAKAEADLSTNATAHSGWINSISSPMISRGSTTHLMMDHMDDGNGSTKGATATTAATAEAATILGPSSGTEDSVSSSFAAVASPPPISDNLLRAEPLDKSNPVSARPHIPSVSASAVLGESFSMPEGTPICRGVDFGHHRGDGDDDGGRKKNKTTKEKDESGGEENPRRPFGHDGDMLDRIMDSFTRTGFQATNLGLAVQQIRRMRSWRLSDVPWQGGEGQGGGIGNDSEDLKPMSVRQRLRARIFLAYTSNQISSGQREVLRFLAEHRMVDVIVTTAGGIEEDLIKCLRHTYIGNFHLDGRQLRRRGVNRIGNLLVPNSNYCEFEDWVTPLIESMHREQDAKWAEWALEVTTRGRGKQKQQRKEEHGVDDHGRTDNPRIVNDDDDDSLPEKFSWTPSKFIRRLGLEIDHADSVLYWAAKNDIPVFCPALTDGSIGDMLYFHSYKSPGFVLDINEDIRRINDLAVRSHATGMIILGGGLVKHHTCNANLMRNGADFSVYVNTGQEFDGSDSGATPDEAISWGKIRATAEPVKVCCDATIAFPLIVSQTFAKDVERWKEETRGTACYVDDLLDV
jgi:deoxyhypusine synthase